MLVLSRKPKESIRIGANISITVLETHGKRVRIGVEAPREVKILRGELTKPREAIELGWFDLGSATLVEAGGEEYGGTASAVLPR